MLAPIGVAYRAGRLTVTDERFAWIPRSKRRGALDVDKADIDRIETSPGMGIGGQNLVVTLRDGTTWAFFMGQRSTVERFLASHALLHEVRNISPPILQVDE